VVPVFNSEAIVPELITEVSNVLEQHGVEFEILLVNDGSDDESWEVISESARRHPQVKGINLSRNYGQHNATLCGLRAASFDISVTMDDDLQHAPAEIPKLLEKIDQGWDVVYGRAKQLKHTRMRSVLTTLTKGVVGRATGLGRVIEQSPFRAIRTELRAAFAEYCGPDVLVDVLLGWGTTRFCSVFVTHRPRRRGKSNYSKKRLFNMGLLVLTGYSTAPLRFASWVGFGLTAFGIVVLCYVVALALFFGSVPGFPFLASLISIFSGAQLFALGLFGEYLTRVFNRSLGRPTYVIKEESGGTRDRL
jgi:undecaprenyl-phosphate 4-deoxy-4-formamido-L-arabinose transferase